MTTASFDAFVDSLLESDAAVLAAAPTKGTTVTFPCGQCGGTGAYQGARVHQEKSHCFACRGLGHFKTSPEARRRHRDAAKAQARGALEQGLAAFAEQEPAMFADLRDAMRTGEGNEFIYSLATQLFKRGTLSGNQVAAWHRGKARLAEIRASRAAEAKQAEVAVDLTPIKIMFESAVAAGLKKPAYRAEGVVLKLAAATGRNPGALYVTAEETGEYLGKVIGATFHPLRSAPLSTVADALHTIAAAPKEAAVRWGRKTGKCSCCGRDLTDKVSVANGIGPICEQKWGF